MVDPAKLFDKAAQAIERRNYEYAITLLQELLTIQPNYVKARKALRETEVRRLQEAGGGGFQKILGYLQHTGTFTMILVHKVMKKHEAVMADCERALVVAPENPLLLKTLALAAHAAGFGDTAVYVIESVLAKGRSNPKILWTAAQLYEASGDARNAVTCLEDYLQLKPNDQEANKWIRDLAARKHMQEGSLEEAAMSDKKDSYRDVLKDKDGAKKLEESQRIPRSRGDLLKAVEQAKEDIQKDTDNVKLVVRLGDMYLRLDDFDNAAIAYKQAQAKAPDDFTIRMRLGDVRIRQLSKSEREARDAWQADRANDALKRAYAATRKQRLQVCVEEFAARVKQYPTDVSLKYAYGTYLFEAGRYDDAIEQFQETVGDPQRRVHSHHMLGRAFTAKKEFDLAVTQFKHALGDGSMLDDVTKGVTYDLAKTYEQMGNDDEARQQYLRLYEVDIKFRDVSQAVQRLRDKAKNADA